MQPNGIIFWDWNGTLLDDVDFGGQGVAGLFPQGLVHPADELAVRSLGCNGPGGFMAGWYSPPFPRYAA